jgi:hemerythrin-like metal-binding protein
MSDDVSTTGLPELDVEHALQMQLVQEFADAVRDGGSADRCAALVEHLLACTEAHFVAEQLLMRLHAYPGYDEHVQQHDILIGELRRLRGDLRSGARKPEAETAQWLRDWLVTHVGTLDTLTAKYLRDAREQAGRTRSG